MLVDRLWHIPLTNPSQCPTPHGIRTPPHHHLLSLHHHLQISVHELELQSQIRSWATIIVSAYLPRAWLLLATRQSPYTLNCFVGGSRAFLLAALRTCYLARIFRVACSRKGKRGGLHSTAHLPSAIKAYHPWDQPRIQVWVWRLGNPLLRQGPSPRPRVRKDRQRPNG